MNVTPRRSSTIAADPRSTWRSVASSRSDAGRSSSPAARTVPTPFSRSTSTLNASVIRRSVTYPGASGRGRGKLGRAVLHDVQHAIETHRLDHAEHLAPAGEHAEAETAVARAQLVADQGADAERVDEADLGQVDHDLLRPAGDDPGDRLVHALLALGDQLAGDVEQGEVTIALDHDLESLGETWPRHGERAYHQPGLVILEKTFHL